MCHVRPQTTTTNLFVYFLQLLVKYVGLGPFVLFQASKHVASLHDFGLLTVQLFKEKTCR